jgi:hypothetical protein
MGTGWQDCTQCTQLRASWYYPAKNVARCVMHRDKTLVPPEPEDWQLEHYLWYDDEKG